MTADPVPTIERLWPDSDGWAAFMTLYRQIFPEWEREDESRITARTATGRYRVHVLRVAAPGIAGFHVVDVVIEPAYAILTFVAVAPEWRGGGLGLRLVADVIARHRDEPEAPTLLVEAEDAPARLYARAGFRALALDYRVPHYDDARAETPMWLLADVGEPAAGALEGAWLRAVIRQMFRDGYGLRGDDPRLARQLARVSRTVPVTTASQPANHPAKQ